MAYLYFNKNNNLIAISRDKTMVYGNDIIVRKTNKSLMDIHKLIENNSGVCPTKWNWNNINNPIITQEMIDEKLWNRKKNIMKTRIKKYAINNSLPSRIEKVCMMDLWDELIEDEWRQLETLYDEQTGG